MELNIPIDNTSEELKEAVNTYKKCLYANEKDLETVKFPCLKYNIYFWHLFKAFTKRINQMRADIKEIKIKLFDYEGNEIDILEEKKQLNEITNNLDSFENKNENIKTNNTNILSNTSPELFSNLVHKKQMMHINFINHI